MNMFFDNSDGLACTVAVARATLSTTFLDDFGPPAAVMTVMVVLVSGSTSTRTGLPKMVESIFPENSNFGREEDRVDGRIDDESDEQIITYCLKKGK